MFSCVYTDKPADDLLDKIEGLKEMVEGSGKARKLFDGLNERQLDVINGKEEDSTKSEIVEPERKQGDSDSFEEEKEEDKKTEEEESKIESLEKEPNVKNVEFRNSAISSTPYPKPRKSNARSNNLSYPQMPLSKSTMKPSKSVPRPIIQPPIQRPTKERPSRRSDSSLEPSPNPNRTKSLFA